MSKDHDRTYPPPIPHPHAVMLDAMVRGWTASIARICFRKGFRDETRLSRDATVPLSHDNDLKESVAIVTSHQDKRGRPTAPGGRQMSMITKSVLAGAVAALGMIAAGDLALGHNRGDARQDLAMNRGAVFALLPQIASSASFDARWSAGFPAESRIVTAAAAQRPTPETAPASECRAQAWPYVSRDCVIAGEGAAPRTAVRTIALDRVQRTDVERR
jgi:hypothetical protein